MRHDEFRIGTGVNPLVPMSSPVLPALVAAAGERAAMHFLEFFAANIRNPHTRRVYYRTPEEFLGWCASADVPSIAAVQPVHVATWIEASMHGLAAPSIKQRLVAIRHLLDRLVNGRVMSGLSRRRGTARHPDIPRGRCGARRQHRGQDRRHQAQHIRRR